MLFALFAALVLALGVAACGDDDDDGGGGDDVAELIESNPDNNGVKITVGSKNFTEQFILGEIYAQALKAAGYDVSTDLNLGSEQVALQALEDGEICGYPEYTSTALTSFFDLRRRRCPTDPAEAVDAAAGEFEQQGLVAFEPAPFNSANAVGTLSRRRGARRRKGLRPGGPVPGPDPVRLARVPPARRLPGRPAGRLRPPVRGVQARGHRAALPGAGQRPGRPVDPVHDRPQLCHRPTST